VNAAERLAESRVDLVGLIDAGIPQRELIPGSVFPRNSRIHVSGGPKNGKSLAFEVAGLRIVKAGGSVVVLDRENSAEEYARRLEHILDSWGADAAFRALIRENYRYHAYPEVSLSWKDDASYVEAFGCADFVVFDSSRRFTSHLGLAENDNDDFAALSEALIDPLWRDGKTVSLLDNLGHEGKHARGASAKADLCEVVYSLTKLIDFNVDTLGSSRLQVEQSRFGEIHGAWDIELGAGHYGQFLRPEAPTPTKTDSFEEKLLNVASSEWLKASELADRIGLSTDDAKATPFRTALQRLVDSKRLSRDASKRYSLPPLAAEPVS
jgi:hypothetical protein